MEKYDFVIIGAGSAGFSAAIYASRFRLKTIVIGELLGGTITQTHLVENWPGEISISGFDLSEKLRKHAEANNVPIVSDRVVDVRKDGAGFVVKTLENNEFFGKTLLFATGSARRKLDVPGIKEFENKGVSYCAVCDAAFFRDKIVGVVGGSDSAVKEALLLSEYAKKVYLIYRGNQLRAEPINAERLQKNKKIDVLYGKNVSAVFGEKILKGIKFTEGGSLNLNGLFIEIGSVPNSGFAQKLGVKVDSKAEIIIDSESRTNVEGIYAAGDVANRHFKQAITGAAEGVIAAFSAYEHLNKKNLK